MNNNCLSCGSPLMEPKQHDYVMLVKKPKVTLQGVNRFDCYGCDNYEVSIPGMGQLCDLIERYSEEESITCYYENGAWKIVETVDVNH